MVELECVNGFPVDGTPQICLFGAALDSPRSAAFHGLAGGDAAEAAVGLRQACHQEKHQWKHSRKEEHQL